MARFRGSSAHKPSPEPPPLRVWVKVHVAYRRCGSCEQAQYRGFPWKHDIVCLQSIFCSVLCLDATERCLSTQAYWVGVGRTTSSAVDISGDKMFSDGCGRSTNNLHEESI
ncbi:uncharacterized protein BO95DRAFT_190740 [Aspergillus brunneoviolaceus CBS 621.78]|uniref:Uncharacterized protein n=1 Tax=Aspergillus brunneoviolaceus CBS 621.78 TaxID=1450534 RepID=A0ACD1G4F3_9EURO|nr:hypothetical protein BO95DRAFT_190740 [Aspergillus brunneoviolaceus CBS 621.78]RAH44043.1 hypothetical protein BO95DRAFT_190740 [Aspergillus brunneoviolaceus CBS 621.78]